MKTTHESNEDKLFVVKAEQVSEVLGEHFQIVYPGGIKFNVLKDCVCKAYPILQELNVLAIIHGVSDEWLNRMAAKNSFYSGYDGHNAVEDGYRNMIKYLLGWGDPSHVVSRMQEELYETLWSNDDLLGETSWLAIFDAGICFVDIEMRKPKVLTWDEFTNVCLDDDFLLFKREGFVTGTFLPSKQFLEYDMRNWIVSHLLELLAVCHVPKIG